MAAHLTRNLVWKVLKANISRSQTAGYALALLAGLAVVMTAVAMYADGLRLAGADGCDKLLPDNYKVLSMRSQTSPLRLFAASDGFSKADIERLEAQPWVKRCAPFETSDFDAAISAEFGSSRFSTAIFFEAVPDAFFEDLPDNWMFDPAKPEVPIILPADYLAIYNFGFAAARGLPRLSERMIKAIPLRIMISSDRGTTTLPGRVAGFSSRLNTIAVPVDFLRWANSHYGAGQANPPSRLIVETVGSAETEAARYFKANGIECSDGNESAGRLMSVLRGTVCAVAAVGCVFCLFSFFLMTLSLRLLVRKNLESIRGLKLLGFPAADISRPYRTMIILTNIAAFVAATCAMTAVACVWSRVMDSVGIASAPLYPGIICGAILAAILTAAGCASIGRMIRKA
ncbi:MAG: hypothetical protein K2G30_08540 [Muribaculaceae bacterium]|nr:hypothetical protein [Muribaculaceae bacterium]